jgi:segregation and condensation protein B
VTETENELKLIVEAALFASEIPLSVSRLVNLFPPDAAPSRDELKAVLDLLEDEYMNRGIELKRVGKAYRFQSCERYSTWLRKLNEGRSPRYSRALLETLAIIAYRQPVTRGDIEEIRGVTVSSETMKILLDREWVKQVGQREVPGRPALFGTTQKFLEYFNLISLSELPPLVEKREPQEIAMELNLRLPLDDQDQDQDQDQDHDQDEDDGRQNDSEPQQHTAEIIHLDSAAEHDQGGGDEALKSMVDGDGRGETS